MSRWHKLSFIYISMQGIKYDFLVEFGPMANETVKYVIDERNVCKGWLVGVSCVISCGDHGLEGDASHTARFFWALSAVLHLRCPGTDLRVVSGTSTAARHPGGAGLLTLAHPNALEALEGLRMCPAVCGQACRGLGSV